jgi:hypothetical protein
MVLKREKSLLYFVRDRYCSAKWVSIVDKDATRVKRIVSSPDISISRERCSYTSMLLRKLPIMCVIKPDSCYEGADSATLRYNAHSRLYFTASISSIAFKLASFREMSISRIGRCRTPNVYQRLKTAAKLASEAIDEMPMIPIRSR